MDRDYNNERGYTHPLLMGRYAHGYSDEDGFHVLWTSDMKELF